MPTPSGSVQDPPLPQPGACTLPVEVCHRVDTHASATIGATIYPMCSKKNTGTNKIDILSSWKPSGAVLADTATILATTRQIAGVDFNGSSDISIPYANLTNRPWITPAVVINFASVYTTRRVQIGTTTEAGALLHLTGNSTIGGTLLLEYQSGTPNIELVRGLTSSTTNFNWNILNDNSFKIQNKTSTNAYADRFTISNTGNVGIATHTIRQSVFSKFAS